jgi:hypothetical protein
MHTGHTFLWFRRKPGKILKHHPSKKMRIVKERIEKHTAAGKSLHEYIISTNRAFDPESLIDAFLMLPKIQKVSVH